MNLSRLKYRSLGLLAAVSGLAAGCETTVSVPAPAHTPRAALLYLLRNKPTADTLYNRTEGWLYASASQNVFSNNRELGRTDATITIAEGAAIVEEFRSVPNTNGYGPGPGYYQPVRNLRGQPGQTYTLRATVPGLEPVESTLTMPYPAIIEDASLVVRPKVPASEYTNDTPARLSVTIRDNAATSDYYLATARLLDADGRPGPWRPVISDYASEENNTFEVGRFQLSRSFTDDYNIWPYADTNVNGQQFTFTSNVRYDPVLCQGNITECPIASYLEVTISTLTPDAYRFLLSKRRYIDSDGNPFAEPAPLYSNIKAGYGLFGGATEVSYRIKLP
jgi:hypothetical protein